MSHRNDGLFADELRARAIKVAEEQSPERMVAGKLNQLDLRGERKKAWFISTARDTASDVASKGGRKCNVRMSSHLATYSYKCGIWNSYIIKRIDFVLTTQGNEAIAELRRLGFDVSVENTHRNAETGPYDDDDDPEWAQPIVTLRW